MCKSWICVRPGDDVRIELHSSDSDGATIVVSLDHKQAAGIIADIAILISLQSNVKTN